jgi:type IV fimbrial biogenesis protein FimT
MRRNQQAFTLIELMVTLVVLAIVVAIGLPNFTTLINNNRSVTLGEEMVVAINLARAEAISRGGHVTLCASTNGTTCGGTWVGGWIVAVDSVGAGALPGAAPNILGVDNVIRVWPATALPAKANIVANANFVRFTGQGTRGRNAQPLTITANTVGCSGNNSRVITIGAAGMVTLAAAGCQ